MKKLSKFIASMFMIALVVISGVMFAGCGEKDFDKDKIKIGQTTFTYDGSFHVFEVTYEDEKDVQVTYSLDGETFVQKKDVELKDVGKYTVYFKLSQNGYKDYKDSKEVVIKGFTITNGSAVTNYATFLEALNGVEENGTLKMYDDVILSQPIVASKTFTLDGQGKHGIIASETFTEGNVLEVEKSNITVTLKDVEIDANQKARVAYVGAGKLVIDGAVLKNGYREDTWAYGVYVTRSASFEMIKGSIIGHQKSEDADYTTKYSADLWIGANATGIISGGELGNMFINANSYSKTNPGKFTVKGGKLYNVYVEYGDGYGAKLEFQGGQIEKLRVSTTESNGSFVEKTATTGTTYVGGVTE